MELLGTPERKRFWESLASEHLDNQQKMKRERERLRRLQAAVAKDLAAARQPELRQYLELTRRLTELLLAQIEALQPDSNVWEYPEPAAIARAEWTLHEIQWLTLLQDELNLTRLEAILAADLEAAQRGEAPQGAYPEAYLAVRQAPGWPDAFRAFRTEFPAFREAIAETRTALEAIDALPPADRLAEAKQLNVPALQGMRYRLEALFRRLPDGEAFLQGMRWHTVDLSGPAKPAAAPGKKRGLTDRMLGFLKPKN